MPKLAVPLTDIKIRKALPKEKQYKLADGGGMYLLVMPDGAKYWRMNYRIAGIDKSNTASFGVYPEMTLLEARGRRAEARQLISQGIHPTQHKKHLRRLNAESAAQTFEKLAREWHSNRLETWSESTARETLSRLEKDIFPEIGSMLIPSITHRHMIVAFQKIERRGAREVARRLKSICSRIFSYANQNGISNNNPAEVRDVLQPIASGHFAAISTDELPAFLSAMRESDETRYVPTRIAMRLMLLLFVRTSELLTTPWKEIDLENGEWIIPWTRMKRGKLTINPDKSDHHVCLSAQALALLRELNKVTGHREYLFPNMRDGNKPMSNGAILMALKRMGYQNKMTGHGFRALAMSTIKEKLGYRHEVVDRQLAHAQKDKVASAYDRAKFLDERRKMMQEWADYLDTVESGRNVVHANFRVA